MLIFHPLVITAFNYFEKLFKHLMQKKKKKKKKKERHSCFDKLHIRGITSNERRPHTFIPTHIFYSTDSVGPVHYENTPIQIYCKFYHKKTESSSDKNSDIFHISAQNIDYGYSLEAPQRGPTIYVLSRNKKNNVYSCKPQFYYIKLGFQGVNII